MKTKDACLKGTTYLALLIMAVCICSFDSAGDITPQVVVFLICAVWVSIFLIANRDSF